MTMHLESTTKRKKKQKSDSYYMDGWREHNKFLKRMKLAKMTLEEYIDYVQGKYKPMVLSSLTILNGMLVVITRQAEHIPSKISEHSLVGKRNNALHRRT